MRKLLLAFLLLLSIGMANAYVGTVRPLYANAGTSIEYYVNIVNPTSSRWDEVSVAVSIPELGIYERAPSFSLSSRNSARKTFFVDLPEDAHGYYPVLITVHRKNGHEASHAWLAIV